MADGSPLMNQVTIVLKRKVSPTRWAKYAVLFGLDPETPANITLSLAPGDLDRLIEQSARRAAVMR